MLQAVIVILLTLGMHSVAAEAIRLQPIELEKAFTSTLIPAMFERGGKYTLSSPYSNSERLSMAKIINDVRSRELDMFWALNTPEYEEEFQPIYIPLYRGIMGMRLPLVRQQDKNIFSKVKSLADLQRFTAGQGTMWADTKILQANGIPVVTEIKYANLFRMLWAERFDYFPRGVQEPWREIEENRQLDLVVDANILIWYQAPFYIYVHKSNRELARHVNEQLEAMIEDGSFLRLFYQDADIRSALEMAKLDQRRVIKIDNPHRSEKTPFKRQELWFDPSEKRPL